jgi:hypothetical protein
MSEQDDMDFERWTGLWEKAAQSGKFSNETTPTKMNNSGGFFGEPVAFDPANGPSADDSAEWNKIYKMTNHWNEPPTHFNESATKVVPDSEDNGETFNEKDIEDLASLKAKLHEIQVKFCEFEGRGQNSKKFESQITSVKKQIDDLSNKMTTPKEK